MSAKPKVHVVDSGLAARLLRLSPEKLSSIDPTSLTEFGHLLETFAIGELHKQASWLKEPVTLGHWGTSDEAEVDLIIEHDDGRVVAFEVKPRTRALGKCLGVRLESVILAFGKRLLREVLSARCW